MKGLTANNPKKAGVFYIILLFVLLLSGTGGFAQNNYSVRNYDNTTGLPQNEIHALKFDKNGFLWIATYGGLCRFDGSGFKSFDVKKEPALNSNRICFLLKDKNQSLWASDEHRQLYRISDKPAIQKDTVIAAQRKCVTGMDAFFCCDKLMQQPGFPAFFYSQGVYDFKFKSYILNNNECYLQIENAVYYLNNNSGTIKRVVSSDSRKEFLQSSFIINGLYVFCSENEINFYREGVQQNYLSVAWDAAKVIRSAYINKGQYFLSDSRVFLSTGDQLYEFSLVNNCITVRQIKTDWIFKTNDVMSVQTEQQTPNIYIGTMSKGLFVLKPAIIKTVVENKSSKAINNSVYDIIPSGDEVITHYQRFNIVTGNVSLFNSGIEYQRGLFYKSSDGSILCSKTNSLYRADSTFNHFVLISPSTNLLAFMEDSRHTIWASADTALWHILPDNSMVKIISTKTPVKSIFEYNPHHFWLLKEDGLFEYDVSKNSISSKPFAPNLLIRNIYRAHDGTIWLATYGNGIYKYVKGKLISLPADDAGSLNIAHNFYEDANGFFWISTNNGLIQCLKKDLEDYIADSSAKPYYYHYNKSDGLSTPEFNGGSLTSYAKDNKGNLIYATASGIAFFSPLQVIPTVNTGNIVIESVVIDDVLTDVSGSIRIPPSFIQIEINIGLPFFGSFENLILEYKVDELSDHWNKIGEERNISINRLPPGSYKLVIRKRNGFGKNNYEYTQLKFEVLPRFYQTWWFIGLAAILLIAGIVALFYFRIIQAKERQKHLEQQVILHTGDLNNTIAKLNDVIEELHISDQKLSESNAVQEKVISIILHDIKTPINYLSVAAAGLSKNLKDLSHAEIEKFSDGFAETARDINSFTQDLLQWLLIQNENFKPRYNMFSVQLFLTEIRLFYKEIAAVKNNTLSIRPSEKDIVISTDYNILKLIVRNLTDNAIKNTKNGSITLAVASYEKYVEIIVEDSGKGITEEEIRQIMSDQTDRMFEGKKLGFSLIKTFLKIVQGEMRITGSPDTGTIITLLFPLNPVG